MEGQRASLTRIARRGLLAAVLLGALGVVTGCERTPPSIVLVTIDTIRADHLGAYGYFRDTSPVFDGFAAEGVLFERAYAPMATTLPVHVSLLTGTTTLRHGVKGNFGTTLQALDGAMGLRTFAQVLRGLGYETAAFVSATPLKRHTGIDAGFVHFDQPSAKRRRAAGTTDRALAWLDIAASMRPIFLWVHYFDPHDPYDPPEPFDASFRADADLRGFLRALGLSEWDDPEIQRINDLYDGEILYTDGQLGRLFAALREAGLWDESAVVVAGDHGEGLGQRDWLEHGRIYDEHIRVPLVIRLPDGEGRGRRSARLASLVDVVPTLVAALDLPVAETDRAQWEGNDLLAPKPPRRFAFAERVHRYHPDWEPGPKYALVGRRWKYFHRPLGSDELFDLHADPLETRNVIEAHPRVAAAMLSRIRRALVHDVRREPEELPLDVREELEALGYVE